MLQSSKSLKNVTKYVKKWSLVPRDFPLYLRIASCATFTSAEYQFMQCSKLPTFYFQRSLPRLPVPKLELTCARFLAAVQPIINAEEYERTVRVLSEFQCGDGAELQTLLQKSDMENKHTSYISEAWFDMYLSDRIPLPLNYNPLLIMKHDTRNEYNNQLLRATNLVISSLRFWRSLQANLLEPEVYHLNPRKSDTSNFRNLMRILPEVVATYGAYAFKAFPLDMSQYNQLFGVSRIPVRGKDRLVQNRNAKHILVMRRGNMYAVDVFDDMGNIVPPHVVLGRLQNVVQLDERSAVSEVPIGVLTAINRDDWADVRQYLINELGAENKRVLEDEVDAALFCLCLDTPDDPVYSEACREPLLKHLLAGDGRNRWFDKSVSLLLSADGTAAINFEHSWGDGVAVLRYFKEIYNESTANPFVNINTVAENACNTNSIRPLKLKTDIKIEAAVQKAISHNKSIMNKLDVHIHQCTHLNKVTCKRVGLSPDAIMQLSFQLAYRRAFNDYVGTYESCSTAAFRHGRTETIRPCTMATKQFCEAIMRAQHKQPTAVESLTMLKQCSQLHNKLTKEAAMGQGFDRHLFALKRQALIYDKPLPQIYKTAAYDKLNYNIISTSTLASEALLLGTFGPVVEDGFGVGYSMKDDYCGAIVTSYKNQRDGKTFADNLEAAFHDINNILRLSTK